MKKLIILISLVASAYISNAQATSSANQNVALSLSNAIAITFVSSGTASGSTVNIPFTNVSDYANGVVSSDQQLKVQSNVHFNVSVQSNGTNFAYSGSVTPAPAVSVASVLQMAISANNTGGSLSYGINNYSAISSGTGTIINWGSPGGNQTFSVNYKANPGFSMPGGTYTTNIIFTATQP
jgi:hypothetical protein